MAKIFKSRYSGTEIDESVIKSAQAIRTINGQYPDLNGDIILEEGSSTIVVDELPIIGDSDLDYILKSGNSYIYYKWINDAWQKISSAGGSKVYVGDELPAVADADTETDYYIGPNEYDIYVHYRLIGEDFKMIGGAGGGDGTGSSNNLRVTWITSSPYICTPTDKVVVGFNYSSTDNVGDTIDGNYIWKLDNTVLSTGITIHGANTFDLTQYVSLGDTKFTLIVTDDAGNSTTKIFTVRVVDIRLETTFDDSLLYSVNDSISFSYTAYGNVDKIVHFILDGKELSPEVVTTSGQTRTYVIPAQVHGSHLLETYITANINNTKIETEHIYKNINCFDSEVFGEPVIGCIYRSDLYGTVNINQYDMFNIPYTVFVDAEGKQNPTVTVTIDGTATQKTLTGTSDIISFKSGFPGPHGITIQCGDTIVTINIRVNKLDIAVDPVTTNLAFDFNPTGLSNSSENRLWTDSTNSNVKLSVSDNFDWSNGGYQIDSDGNQYFCVKSGTTATISYNLFERDAKKFGAEFKAIFKTTNVRDIDATFLTCENNSVGLEMCVHNANIKTSGGTLFAPYSEEDIIEFDYNIDILNTNSSDAKALILTYEDGTPFRPMEYDDTHRIYQTNPVPITIGSEDCDVHIYRMRAYTAPLSSDEILTNFIADGRDAESIISRFNRNQIYDENNMVTPDSVAKACPDVKIIKIEVPYFTKDKNEFVKASRIECIHKNGDPVRDNWVATNCFHSGQGTTSNEYGYAGRNIDILMCFDGKYKNKKINGGVVDPNYITQLTMGDGTVITDGTGKIQLSENSVPNNYYNIKVNIASSENANNALLANRYNRYLPYKSIAQVNDPRVKNTMEFVNCIVFVRETDPDISNHREYGDTEWHKIA